MLRTEPSPPATATVLPSIDQSRPYTPLGIVMKPIARCASRSKMRSSLAPVPPAAISRAPGSFENWQA